MPARCGLQGRVIRSTVGGGGPTDSLRIINWFQIDQHNQFGTLAPQEVVDLGGAAPPGNFVTRSPVTGQILEVTSAVTNLGNGRTEGIEFGFTYSSKEYSWGKIDLQFDGSYLYWLTQQTLQGVNANGTLFFRGF